LVSGALQCQINGRVAELAAQLAATASRPWTVMEVCGGQTHAILRWGLDQLLPPSLRLIHGPGCPVCVTPAATLDAALALAQRPEVILCSYGDMLRVPGSGAANLLTVRAGGADVRLLTSPLQALELARAIPKGRWCFWRWALKPPPLPPPCWPAAPWPLAWPTSRSSPPM
jgi:hydrogenase expression/formation protein HypD